MKNARMIAKSAENGAGGGEGRSGSRALARERDLQTDPKGCRILAKWGKMEVEKPAESRFLNAIPIKWGIIP